MRQYQTHQIVRRSISTLLCFLSIAALGLAGCGDTEGGPDVVEDAFTPDVYDVYVPGANACDGWASLLLDGVAASPGDSCGPCGDGVVACLGRDRLRCVDATPRKACDGCEPLGGAPGASCGVCGLGAFVCDGTESVTCEGDRTPNACGGCLVILAEPDEECGTVLDPAHWVCAAPDELRCVAEGDNVCGGVTALDGVPGAPCGDCGRGHLSCLGADALACEDALAGVNACGGCVPLTAEPGASCGDCGGFYECADDGTLVCNQQRNGCGGCVELEDIPGTACGTDGVWVCNPDGTTRCATPDTNSCGGNAVLDAVAGEACGACGDGVQTCIERDTLVCLRGTAANACGSCGPLAGEPGEPCAANAVFACRDGGVTCEPRIGLNECGGVSPLEAIVGAPCGLCESGAFVCAGTEALTCADEQSEDELTWYVDGDGDGFYAEGAEAIVACEDPGEGYAQTPGDCDDDNDDAYPDAPEDVCTDNVDLNCDGVVAFVDADGDGASACFDCDDNNANVRPSAREVCDGIDQDCDEEVDEGAEQRFYRDADDDGFGDRGTSVQACSAPTGYVSNGGDCDDDNDGRHPDAEEVCDGLDNRCDGQADPPTAIDASQWFPDADSDGYGSPFGVPVTACAPPAATGWADNDDDCNDGDDAVHPGADELCDGIDNNCNRVSDEGAVDRVQRYVDADEDGFGDPASPVDACPDALGYADTGTDCDDSRGDTWPGAPERIGDGRDQDCNGRELCYLDADGDGYVGDFVTLEETTDLTCSGLVACPEGVPSYRPDGQCYLSVGLSAAVDCNDVDPLVAPGLADEFGDGIDSNCDGTEVCFRDLDGDGYAPSRDAIILSNDADCTDFGELGLFNIPFESDCWDAEFDAADGTGCRDVSNGATPLVCPDEVHPGVEDEVERYDDGLYGVDYDCNRAVACYIDGDGDGYRTDAWSVMGASPSSDPLRRCENYPRLRTEAAPIEQDWCDDDSGVRPGQSDEENDGIDSNCDGQETCFVDWDDDEFFAPDLISAVTCDATGCWRDGLYGREEPRVQVTSEPIHTGICEADVRLSARGCIWPYWTCNTDCNDFEDSIHPEGWGHDFPDVSPDEPGLYDADCDGRDGSDGIDEYVECVPNPDAALGGCDTAPVVAAVEACGTKHLSYPREHCTVFVEVGTYVFTSPLVVSGRNDVHIAGGYWDNFTERHYGLSAPGWLGEFGDAPGWTTTFRGANPAVTIETDADVVLSGLRLWSVAGTDGVWSASEGRPSVGVFASGAGVLRITHSQVVAARGGDGHTFPWETFPGPPFDRGGAGGSPGGAGSAAPQVNGGAAGAKGQPGGNGRDGACGAGAERAERWPGTMTHPSSWAIRPSHGEPGTLGTSGGGGGGSLTAAAGGSGGKGGAGGVAGDGGDGGGHGGPSIAVAAHNTQVAVEYVTLSASRGGHGGDAQDGGNGGAGVVGHNATGGGGAANGGHGGAGGGGGHAGPSLRVLLSGEAAYIAGDGVVAKNVETARGGQGSPGGERGSPNTSGGVCEDNDGDDGLDTIDVTVGFHLETASAF